MIRTKRWNDPVEPEDGFRLLICRYRPRGVPKAGEPWDAWCTALAPSPELLAAFYGKSGPPIEFPEYERRFRIEMREREYWIAGFAERVRAGETITLLCASSCKDPARCHRSLVQQLIESAAFPQKTAGVVRRARAEPAPAAQPPVASRQPPARDAGQSDQQPSAASAARSSAKTSGRQPTAASRRSHARR
jgi:uncharacterized protein YeaO (DUF488 family)